MSTKFATKTLKGVFWGYAASYSGKLLVFISTLVLSRLLDQEAFGVAGYAIVVMSILEVVRGLGINSALIFYGKDESMKSSAFWLSIVIGVIFLGLTWVIIAPLAGVYFDDPRAVDVLRVLALTFPLNALAIVHDAILSKHLRFRLRFVPEVLRSLTKGIVAIVFAVLGYGAWSLIYGQLGGVLVSVIVYWWVVAFRPKFTFNPQHARKLLHYGTAISTISWSGILVNNADYLLVGRYLGATALGVYTLAYRLPEMLIKQIYTRLGRVLFPIYTKLKDQPAQLKAGYLYTLRYVSLITVPIGLGLCLVAQPLVLVLFTEKWAEVGLIIPAIALSMMLRSLVFTAGEIYKASGKLQLLSRLKLFEIIILLPALWWASAIQQNLVIVSRVIVVQTAMMTLIYLWLAGQVLDIKLTEFWSTLRPIIVSATVMTVLTQSVLTLVASQAPFVQVLMAIATGALTYTATLWIVQRAVILDAKQSIQAAMVKG